MLKSKSHIAAAGTAIAVAASVTAVLLLGGGSAIAAGSTPALPANSVTGPVQIKDGTVWQSDLAPAFVKALYGVYNNTVTTPSIVKGAVTEDKLSDDLKAKVNAPDALGKGSVVADITAKTITKIGGHFVIDKTHLGDFTLPKGTWLVTTNAVFDRTESAAAGDPLTRPQLALRYGEGPIGSDTQFGQSAGTIMGVDISPTKGRELMGATVQTITFTRDRAVHVYGFGYDDAGGSSASGKITAAAQITATKIG